VGSGRVVAKVIRRSAPAGAEATSGPFEIATRPAGTVRVTSNGVLKRGSSNPGKRRLASIVSTQLAGVEPDGPALPVELHLDGGPPPEPRVARRVHLEVEGVADRTDVGGELHLGHRLRAA